ncbi:ribonuclease HIII [Pontibacillus salicampi]|uniref:Ribonuclease HIII n=1 Tax=Pontibacillus salicampi TaxID=1449801 RepID=A0ABV6LJ58_9BACI
MSQSVLKLSKQQIYSMKKHYYTSLKGSTPPGSIFSAKVQGCSITAYQSGKVLFQGPNHFQEANKWGNAASSSPSKKSTKPNAVTPYTPSDKILQSSHVGSDEAGTGDYFGPITVACAYVTEEQTHALKQIGVKDSKHLKDPEIQRIAKRIVEMNIPYSLVVLRNEKYNQLQQKGWTQGKMKTMLHHQAYKKLVNKLGFEPEAWVIDQFAQPQVYKKHLASEKEVLPPNTYFLTKAESHSIAVAAGSIIARSAFVKQMNKLSEEAGMELLKGASQRVDQVAATLIQQQGSEALQGYAKVHFANTEKALERLHKR